MKSFSELTDWNQQQVLDLERRIRGCVTAFNAMVATIDRSEDEELPEEVARWMQERVDVPSASPQLSGRITVDSYVQHQRQKIDRAVASVDAELRARLEQYVTHRQGRDTH